MSLGQSTTLIFAALSAEMGLVHMLFCEIIRIQIWAFVLRNSQLKDEKSEFRMAYIFRDCAFCT
jgi:hypothetical protein